jgi:methionyl-tRNA synthetase
MADQIKGFNWLNYYGGKFSTSSKRGVFLDRAIEILPADYWRYSLLAMAPESSDSEFTWELLQVKVNKELADTFGNFVNRILKFAAARFGSTLPEGGSLGEREQQLQITCENLVGKICDLLRGMEFRKATEALYSLWSVGNQYIDERAPWSLIKENREEAALVIRTCINLIRLYAIASHPFIPFTSEQLFDALHLSEAARRSKLSDAVKLDALAAGHPFEVPPPLFQKLEDSKIEELRTQFGG